MILGSGLELYSVRKILIATNIILYRWKVGKPLQNSVSDLKL